MKVYLVFFLSLLGLSWLGIFYELKKTEMDGETI